jgi:hypothetical protein
MAGTDSTHCKGADPPALFERCQRITFSGFVLARYQCNGLGDPHAGAGIVQGFKPFCLHGGEHLDSFQDSAQ